MRCAKTFRSLVGLLAILAGTPALAADTIKIGFLDPLSGPFANVGEHGTREMLLALDGVNNAGGVLGGRKFELETFDSKSSPQEALISLKQMTDKGIRYFFMGNGSNVAIALSDAVSKHNARNPDQSILFLNYGAVDPSLTNDKCSFWHFRFDADTDMKMQALTNYMAQQKNIKKVYLINQDYAFGQGVSRAGKAMLAQKRPDIEIVGDDLHPVGKVKDFAPYVSKIKASGADSVITGNWGNDLSLLIKAAKESGLKADFYTYYSGIVGSPTAIGQAGEDVRQVSMWHSNVGDPASNALVEGYRKRFPDAKDDFFFLSLKNSVEMLAAAMNEAKSTDPAKVARALEGMKHTGPTGVVEMRADNHQLLQPLFISSFVKAGQKGAKYDVERTGMGFKTVGRVEAKDTALPTTCKMERP
ncbi:MAG TPA: branched-chain amino acid ABC transporter substrate-binding protein [Burkholderiales bacterium]|nr:branched-chain amino acid ABC transporter substrate-binding protein [Burkholderiales bacterium]